MRKDKRTAGMKMSPIGELMIQSDITQAQLAKELDVVQYTVFKWIWGLSLPNGYSTIKLAKYFNVSADYILGLKEK